MEYLELVIRDLELRVREAVGKLATATSSTVSLGAATYEVSAHAKETVDAVVKTKELGEL